MKAAIKALEEVADEIGRIDDVEERAPEPVPTSEILPPQSGEITVGSFPQQRQVRAKKAAGAIVTFEDHAAYTDTPRRKILHDLRRRVLSLDDRLQQPRTEFGTYD